MCDACQTLAGSADFQYFMRCFAVLSYFNSLIILSGVADNK
jgi:hypothetical protein